MQKPQIKVVVESVGHFFVVENGSQPAGNYQKFVARLKPAAQRDIVGNRVLNPAREL
jgi:hypothetical protein